MSRSWGDRVSDEERETEERRKRDLEMAYSRGRREGMAEVRNQRRREREERRERMRQRRASRPVRDLRDRLQRNRK